MDAGSRDLPAPHLLDTPLPRFAEAKGSQETRFLKQNKNTTQLFFFQKILLGENYKTFTVQCLQSQFVVNWFPKIYYNSSWLISLHSKTYFCQSSPECTRGAPTVPTAQTKRLIIHLSSGKAGRLSCLFTMKNNSTSSGLSLSKVYSCTTNNSAWRPGLFTS